MKNDKIEKNNKKNWIIVLLLFLFLGCFASLYLDKEESSPSLDTDTNINIGDIEGLSEEEIQENLNALVEYNKININMNTSISAYKDQLLNIDLKNETNKYEGYRYDTSKHKDLLAISCEDKESQKVCTTAKGRSVEVSSYKKVVLEKSLQVKIKINNSEKYIFESGLIPYGAYLKVGDLKEKLPVGKYRATAEIYSYDVNKNLLGQSNVLVDIYSVDKNGNTK